MPGIVVPTILATTADEYKAMLEKAAKVSDRVHIDICDGQFADQKTINLAEVHVPEGVSVDLHLMVQDPVSLLDTAISLHPNLIIFHAESQADFKPMIDHCHMLGVQAGLALLPQTDPQSLADLIVHVDHVLVFTGTLGHNGGSFNAEVLPKAQDIRRINPNIDVSIDGGVTDANASLAAIQGVNIFYVGSAIQNAEDPQKMYDDIMYQVATDEL